MTEKLGVMTTWVSRVLSYLGTHLCRHDYLRVTEGNRVYLRCEYCQRETPGWDLSGIQPRHVFDGDPERFKRGVFKKQPKKVTRTKRQTKSGKTFSEMV